ncbi:hypothetical protein D1609_18520 [Leptospira borgpetersenii serovar Hardjo-bovis]|nr:hypothetical protein D1609_18520 [Leptospira borgpetersenii serovar Hardjo-bovis]
MGLNEIGYLNEKCNKPKNIKELESNQIVFEIEFKNRNIIFETSILLGKWDLMLSMCVPKWRSY